MPPLLLTLLQGPRLHCSGQGDLPQLTRRLALPVAHDPTLDTGEGVQGQLGQTALHACPESEDQR